MRGCSQLLWWSRRKWGKAGGRAWREIGGGVRHLAAAPASRCGPCPAAILREAQTPARSGPDVSVYAYHPRP
jgi:hypothetical protein